FLVVAAELRQRDDEAAGASRWPQPHVDRVEPAGRSLVAGGTNNPLGELGEEVEVVGQVEAIEAGGAGRRGGAAVALVDQDQVEIAVVVQFATAELAQAEQGVATPPARGQKTEVRSQRRIAPRRLVTADL